MCAQDVCMYVCEMCVCVITNQIINYCMDKHFPSVCVWGEGLYIYIVSLDKDFLLTCKGSATLKMDGVPWNSCCASPTCLTV